MGEDNIKKTKGGGGDPYIISINTSLDGLVGDNKNVNVGCTCFPADFSRLVTRYNRYIYRVLPGASPHYNALYTRPGPLIVFHPIRMRTILNTGSTLSVVLSSLDGISGTIR